MPRIKTDALQAGMVVAADVKNLDHVLLIGAGTALTERQIGILQAWGVAEVEVNSADGLSGAPGVLEQLPAELVERLRSEVKSLFWHLDETCPVQAEIYRLALQRRAAKCLPAAPA